MSGYRHVYLLCCQFLVKYVSKVLEILYTVGKFCNMHCFPICVLDFLEFPSIPAKSANNVLF